MDTFVTFANGELLYFSPPLKTGRRINFSPTDFDLYNAGWSKLYEVNEINDTILTIAKVDVDYFIVNYKGILPEGDTITSIKNPNLYECWITSVVDDKYTASYYDGKDWVEIKNNDFLKYIASFKHQEENNSYMCVEYKYNTDKTMIETYLDKLVNRTLYRYVKSKGYDSVESMASYVNSGNEEYSAESEEFVLWRSKVWEYINNLKVSLCKKITKNTPYKESDILKVIGTNPTNSTL